jgi:hypothetical protein
LLELEEREPPIRLTKLNEDLKSFLGLNLLRLLQKVNDNPVLLYLIFSSLQVLFNYQTPAEELVQLGMGIMIQTSLRKLLLLRNTS